MCNAYFLVRIDPPMIRRVVAAMSKRRAVFVPLQVIAILAYPLLHTKGRHDFLRSPKELSFWSYAIRTVLGWA